MKHWLAVIVLLGAIRDKDNQGRWEKRVEKGPDSEESKELLQKLSK